MEQKTKINAEEGRQDLTITRDFELPVELLYKAYTEPGIIEQWMGTKVLKWENKKYGYYEFETSHNGKVLFSAHGCIHEIIPNKKIIRTFEMDNAAIGAQMEVLDFEELTKDSSRLLMHVIFQSEEHRAKQLKLPFAYGINVAHNRLQEILNPNK